MFKFAEFLGEWQFGDITGVLEWHLEVDDFLAASRQHDDAVPQQQCLAQVMRNEDDAASGLFPDLQELRPDFNLGLGIQRSERLVHQQQVGAGNPGPGESHALSHSLGQLPGEQGTLAFETETGQHRFGPTVALVGFDAIALQR